MKTVVYTATFGPSDDLQPIARPLLSARHICLTDNHEPVDGWEMVNPELHCGAGRAEHERCKALPHKYFPGADISVWCCWGVTLLADAETAIGWLPDDKQLAVATHPYRDCVYDEVEAVVQARKETRENADNLERLLRSDGYPEHNGLAATTVLIRRHTPEMERFNELWWDLICRYSLRDQLTFDYVSWSLGIPYEVLPWDLANSPYWAWVPHD